MFKFLMIFLIKFSKTEIKSTNKILKRDLFNIERHLVNDTLYDIIFNKKKK